MPPRAISLEDLEPKAGAGPRTRPAGRPGAGRRPRPCFLRVEIPVGEPDPQQAMGARSRGAGGTFDSGMSGRLVSVIIGSRHGSRDRLLPFL